MSDKTYELTMLYDFFGELLTGKQREYFEYYYCDDLSLGEISELTGVCRQGVRDTLLRTERLLRQYEDKTGVVARFMSVSRRVDSLLTDAERLSSITEGEAHELAERLSQGLVELKG